MILRLRAGQELHAAALEVGGRERHPGGHHRVLAQTPVEGILMPGYEPGAVRLLDEEIRGPAEQIGPQHILGGIDDPGVVHDLVDPGEEQVRLVPPVALQRSPGRGLVPLEAAAIAGHLSGGKRRHREVVAVAAIGIERRTGKHLGHRVTSDGRPEHAEGRHRIGRLVLRSDCSRETPCWQPKAEG